MKIKGLNEITSAGSIAANPSGGSTRDHKHAEHEWRAHSKPERKDAVQSTHAREQIARAKAIKAERERKPGFRDFARRLLKRKQVTEATAMDVPDVMSRLKGLEQKNSPDAKNTVTYGVEDDEGNVMKITVKGEQADSFEQTLAVALGELEDNNIYGYDKNASMSLAELLYNLKNEFDIVDVEFPEIPSDVVYNADKATYGMDTDDVQSATPPGGEGGDEMGMGDEDVPPMDDGTGGPDMSGMGAGPAGGMGGAEGGEEDMGDTGEANPDELDADMGEEFPEDEEAPATQDSLYQELIKMFTAQADAEKAKADAEAEKARALQAEYSAQSANHEMSRQEELARMDADLETQKQKSKEAKKMSNLAKFRVQNGTGKMAQSSAFEGVSSFLDAALGKQQRHLIKEDDDEGTLQNVQSLQRELNAAKQKWAPTQNDPPLLQQYKQSMLQSDTAIIQQKIKKTRLTLAYNQKTAQSPNPTTQQQSNTNNGAPSVANDTNG